VRHRPGHRDASLLVPGRRLPAGRASRQARVGRLAQPGEVDAQPVRLGAPPRPQHFGIDVVDLRLARPQRRALRVRRAARVPLAVQLVEDLLAPLGEGRESPLRKTRDAHVALGVGPHFVSQRLEAAGELGVVDGGGEPLSGEQPAGFQRPPLGAGASRRALRRRRPRRAAGAIGQVEDDVMRMQLRIECAARIVIEAGDDQVSGRHQLAVPVLGQRLLFEHLERPARRGDVSPLHARIGHQQRHQRHALVRRHHEVPGRPVLAGAGLGRHQLAAVERGAACEENLELFQSDPRRSAGESEPFRPAPLPDPDLAAPLGGVVIAPGVVLAEVVHGLGRAKRLAGTDHEPRSAARAISRAVASAAASLACSTAAAVASGPSESIISACSR